MLKRKVKVVLKIKPKSETPIMDFLEREIRRIPIPAFLQLSKASYQKAREEFKKCGLDNCWADERFGPNYRGIPIKIIKGAK